MEIFRLFVEKREGFDIGAKRIGGDIKTVLDIELSKVRVFIRYDISGLEKYDLDKARHIIFSELPCDYVYDEEINLEGYSVFAVEYLPGQYDQRADSAEQCVQLLTQKERPKIRCATVYAIMGVDENQLKKIKKYLINPVEAHEAELSKPLSLDNECEFLQKVKIVSGFIKKTDEQIKDFHNDAGFAMTVADLKHVRDYFTSQKRNPTETELKVIDTYWSDHCRHTTFLTELIDVEVNGSDEVKKAYKLYKDLFEEINGTKKDKYPCLMDIATIGAKKLKLSGCLNDIDISDEINACSIKVKAEIDGKSEDWLVMFKNETHNHPTEIEPFGGAATCLGGAIRDPLSGRTYVYQAMRVTGCGDPLTPISETLPGKLPQRVITKTAAAGFSSYGNQIGLATGIVAEIYHKGYVAKRLETGFVVGAVPQKNVYREKPENGDIIVLLGGDTGRDGCGGATGSSKAHTACSVEQCGAEVQKGNPLTERKIQRLFRKKEVTVLIKKCNDFGAGGVCVAIGELAESLIIDLSSVPKKYNGLNGTELAISESQERMAVVLDSKDVDAFINAANSENLTATVVAKVTDNKRLQMVYDGEMIVDISREFLDTNGVKQTAKAVVNDNVTNYIFKPSKEITDLINQKDYNKAVLTELSRLNVCSNKGLSEMFDSTIGSGSVYMPFGGKYQLTPAIAMAAKLPVLHGYTEDCTVSTYACYPDLLEQSPFAGSIYSVLCSVAKLVACGADRKRIRLTLQEFFKRLKNDPIRWGQPLSALLGALTAQINLQTAAIGGKDSMSGTFENLDVPPTLISFALSPEKADKLITNVIQNTGVNLYAFKPEYNKDGICDFDYIVKLYDKIHENIINGNIEFATVSEEGGIACAVIKSCLGNGLGFNFNENISAYDLFSPLLGTIIISANNINALSEFNCDFIGKSTKDNFSIGGQKVSVEEAMQSYTEKLEKVFKSVKTAEGKVENLNYVNKSFIKYPASIARPNVLIPVFPGTNCEYDTAKKFTLQGGNVMTCVIRNKTPKEIEESVDEVARLIDKCQIIAFPGGFSGGDEPDGSGKFIATTFKNPKISDKILRLLNLRDGLIIGICNGFQALIKMGLVPCGEFVELGQNSPTLTFNNISRHVSTLSNIRVASNKSPWLYGVNTGDVFAVPVSHGEGKFVCSENELKFLIENGQIATQYVDLNGNATMESPYNPNGSIFAVEGITSPCGRILGKMGHSERSDKNLYKNYKGNFDMRIFESGISYFK